MEFSVIPGRIQMERCIPMENFRKKGNTFRGISFIPLLLEFPKISVPFVYSYSARLFTVTLPRKNAKDLKDGGRFPKRLSLQCVSLLVGSVGGHFRTQQQPCRWKRIKFSGRYLCFSSTCMIRGFQRASAWATSWEKMWMLIAGFPDEMWMLQQPKEEIIAFFSKKKKFRSRPIKRKAPQEVKLRCFLLTLICTQTPAHWHPKIPIKWYSSIYFVSRVEKKVQFHLFRKNHWKFHSNGKHSRFHLE